MDFYDLPFTKRPDLTPFLIHLTKSSADKSAFDNLVNILKTGVLYGSGFDGFIRGGCTATCFMDVPFNSLKYILTPDATNPNKPRYEPFGVFVGKVYAYEHGLRPVLYLSSQEIEALAIPKEEQWRVVRLEVDTEGRWTSWLHEREWRRKGDMHLPLNCSVLVRDSEHYQKLLQMINEDPESFTIKPRVVIPLSFICQGFLSND